MKSLPFAHQTNRFRRGFTLVELTVAASLLGMIGVVTFGVLRSGAVLSSQNTNINVSASRARLALDQIGDRTRYGLDLPALMDKTGALVTGTTADGVVIKKSLGSPYVLKEAGGTTGDIADTAKTFVLEYRTNPATMPAPVTGSWTLEAPVKGDWILVESVSRPELEIADDPVVLASVGNMKRVSITTKTAIGELARPSFYRVGAYLFRKEAYVFVATDATGDPRYELRHFPRVGAATNYTTASSYTVEANGYRRLSNQAFFTNSLSNGADTTTLRALVNSSDQQQYVARSSKVSTFTTVPIQLRLWSLNR